MNGADELVNCSDTTVAMKISCIDEAVNILSTSQSRNEIYNALIATRTVFLKQELAIPKLREGKVFPKLLQILEGSNLKWMDITLSILGNCCMEKETQLEILALNGIKTIGMVLKNIASVNIQNRACRTLANLAQNSQCCKVIHDDGVMDHGSIVSRPPIMSVKEKPTIVECIVDLLKKTESPECQQTVLRAIRILADTSVHEDNILEYQGLKSVSKCLVVEDTDVLHTALKTIGHVMHSVSKEQIVWQFVNGNGPSALLKLTNHDKEDISAIASSLLLAFTKQPLMRPCLGNAGAVEFFLEHSKQQNKSAEERIPFINALSLFCHEVVNRVRIRDNKGLELFIDCLKNNEYYVLHYRLISSLTCFLYDDLSLEIFLNNDIVSVLIKQLLHCAQLENSGVIDIFINHFCQETRPTENVNNVLNSVKSKEKDEDRCLQETSNVEIEQSLTLHEDNLENKEKTLSFTSSTALSPHSTATLDEQPTAANKSPQPFLDNSPSQADEKHTTPVTERHSKLKYSMDSPSYREIPEWEESSDFTPRNIFEAHTTYTESPGGYPYHSPVHSAPYSPLRFAPCPSPPSSWTSSSGSGSPPSSPASTDFSSHGQVEEEDADSSSSSSPNSSLKRRSDVDYEQHAVVCSKRRPSPTQFLPHTQTTKSSLTERFKRKSSSSSSHKTTPSKTQLHARKATEKSILAILSRLSYTNDYCATLLTPCVFDSLLFYLLCSHSPVSRADRLFTRLLSNPICLETLLYCQVPVKIDCILYFLKEIEAHPLKYGSMSKTSSENSPFFGDEKSSPKNVLVLGKLLLNVERCEELLKECMVNICNIASYGYGKGMIEHIYASNNRQMMAVCALSLPSLCKSEKVLYSYMLEQGALSGVMQVMKDLCQANEEQENTLMCLTFCLRKLTENSDLMLLYRGIGLYFKCINFHLQHNSPVQRQKDVEFLLDSGEMVSANRALVASQSPVFSALLSGEFSESKQTTIRIKCVQYKAFVILLELMNGCTTQFDSEIARCNSSIQSSIHMNRKPSHMQGSLEKTKRVLNLSDDSVKVVKREEEKMGEKEETLDATQSSAEEDSFMVLMQLLELCNRFLLTDLLHDISNVFFDKIVNNKTIVNVLLYAIKYNCSLLADRCTAYIFLHQKCSLMERYAWLKELLLDSDFTQDVVELFQNIFQCHLQAQMGIFSA